MRSKGEFISPFLALVLISSYNINISVNQNQRKEQTYVRYSTVCRKFPVGTPVRMGAAFGKVMGYDTRDKFVTATLKIAFDCEPRSVVTIEPEDMMLVEVAEQGDRVVADIAWPPILLPCEKETRTIEEWGDQCFKDMPVEQVLPLLSSTGAKIRYLNRLGYSRQAIRNWTNASYRVIRNTCIRGYHDRRPTILDFLPNGFEGYRLDKPSIYGYMSCRECKIVFKMEHMYRMPMKDNPKVILRCCPKCGECDFVQPITAKDALTPLGKIRNLKRIGDTYV